MRFLTRFSLPLTLVAVFAVTLPTMPLHAQSADTAGLEVDVRDPSGALMPGAKLELVNTSTHVSREGVSDKEGRYRFVDVPVGDYTLTINKEGFNEVVESGIELSVAQAATLPVSLKVLNSQQQVDVTSEVPLVDQDRTTTGQTISTMEIENLPSNGRNFVDFALTVPGVTPQATSGQGSGLSINGQRSRSNNIMIDGVENNGDLNGTVRQTLSQDAISQFQVMTNQFLPEYGNAGGGLVNVVTKSGTDQFHGDVFYFARNAALNAHPYCFVQNCPAPIFVQNDVGATLGGPIWKDRTFFFASVEYLGLSTNTVSNVNAATVAGVNAVLAIRPLVNGGVKSISANNSTYQSNTQTIATVRFDHSFGPKDTMSLRAIYGQYNHNNPTLDRGDGSYSDISDYGFDHLQAYNFTLSYTHIFTPRVLNELHLQASPQHLQQIPNDPLGPAVNIGSTSGTPVQFGRNTDFPTLLNENHFELQDSISWQKGNHLFKFGTDVDTIRANTSFPTDFAGLFDFTCVYSAVPAAGFPVAPAGTGTCIDNLEDAKPYQFVQGFGTPKILLPDWLFAGYAEDSWKLLPNLTMNYGGRYDFDMQPQGFNLNLSNPIQAPLPKGIPRDHNNVSPRIALAWGVDKSGKTVVRAGFGIFYDKIFLLVARNTLLARNTLVETLTTPTTSQQQFAIGPYPQSASYPTGVSVPTPSINSITSIMPIPYAQQADLYVDRALSKAWSLEVGYLYVSGAKELKSSNVNLAPPVITTTGSFQQIGRPYYSQGYLNPSFSAIQEVGSWGHSRYGAMQASVIHSATRNMSLRASWVWSKEIDDASDFTQAQQPDNPYNPHAERSLGDEDQRNRFVGSAVYTIPYHRGTGMHGSALKWVFGDWIGSAITSVYSGSPWNIVVGSDVNGDTNASPDRPYINGLNGLQGGYIVKRNDFRGARQQNVSLRLQKRINFTEFYRLEFSVESFNTFNHANFSAANTVWGTGATPTNTYGYPTPLTWGKVYHATAANPSPSSNTFGAFSATSSSSTTPGQRSLQLGTKFFF